MNWYQEKICLRIHKCTEAESLSSPFSTRPTEKMEQMEIISKSRITTYILPYSLWKSLQRSVLGNERKWQLRGIVGEILSALVLETIDVFTIYFMQTIPRKTRKQKLIARSMHLNSTSKILFSLSNTKISWYSKTTLGTFHSTDSKKKNIW